MHIHVRTYTYIFQNENCKSVSHTAHILHKQRTQVAIVSYSHKLHMIQVGVAMSKGVMVTDPFSLHWWLQRNIACTASSGEGENTIIRYTAHPQYSAYGSSTVQCLWLIHSTVPMANSTYGSSTVSDVNIHVRTYVHTYIIL